jgi:phage terminase small subunit
MAESRFTPKQAMFIAEYLVDSNGTRAALAAGVAEKSASVTASRWLKTRRIAAVIAERQAQMAAKLEITAERVLGELAKLAYFDPGKLFDEYGRMRPIHQLDDVTRAAVASLEVEETIDAKAVITTCTKKVKMADKGQNLERLGRYLKLFTDRIEHDGRVTLEQLVCGMDPVRDGKDNGGEQAA